MFKVFQWSVFRPIGTGSIHWRVPQVPVLSTGVDQSLGMSLSLSLVPGVYQDLPSLLCSHVYGRWIFFLFCFLHIFFLNSYGH